MGDRRVILDETYPHNDPPPQPPLRLRTRYKLVMRQMRLFRGNDQRQYTAFRLFGRGLPVQVLIDAQKDYC